MGAKKGLRKLELETGKIIIDRLEKETEEIVLGPGQFLTIFILPSGIHKSKRLDVYLRGEGARLEILGAVVGRQKEHSVLAINTIHEALNTTAHTHIRGVLFDESQADFAGLIKIKKGADKTSSLLEHRVLALGDGARCQSVPSLEIEADDVKASHAATVGRLDETQLFYLRSRGIPLETATRMIVEGFFEPVLRRIYDKEAAELIRGELWTGILRG